MIFHVTSFLFLGQKFLSGCPSVIHLSPPCLFYMIAGRLALIGARIGTTILFSSACFNPLFFILR